MTAMRAERARSLRSRTLSFTGSCAPCEVGNRWIAPALTGCASLSACQASRSRRCTSVPTLRESVAILTRPVHVVKDEAKRVKLRLYRVDRHDFDDLASIVRVI